MTEQVIAGTKPKEIGYSKAGNACRNLSMLLKVTCPGLPS